MCHHVATAVFLIMGLAKPGDDPAPALPPHPASYLCLKTETPPVLDGSLDDPAWTHAPWTDDFQDIQGDRRPRPRFRTRAKMLWDDRFFYVAAEMEEPHVNGFLTRHDSVIFQDNDFEVFIDPDGDTHRYYEFEINALNTGWDLFLPRPYRAGGVAVDSWEIPGLRTAVAIQGTINDPADTDRGWTLELAFPWAVLAEHAGKPAPPRPGDQWRVNFSRVQWKYDIVDGAYRKTPDTPEDNWVWSPQGVIDMHRPELWGVVEFANADADLATTRPRPLADWNDRAAVMAVFQAQTDHKHARGTYAATIDELGLAPLGVTLILTRAGFVAQKGGWEVRQDSLLRKVVITPEDFPKSTSSNP